MEDKINISELICTRISHDLIGNIGAFANAVELLEDEDDDFIDEIKNTLKTSSEVLTARLKFFRMAFGLTNANLENIETVKKVTEDYLQTLNLNHPVKADIKIINSPFNRAVMLACMCAAEVIVRGGTVKVRWHKTKYRPCRRCWKAARRKTFPNMPRFITCKKF